MLKYVLIVTIILEIILSEQPLSSCPGHRPFKLADSSCGKFNDVCFKKDSDCEQYQNACLQCPATNFSFLMFNDMVTIKDLTDKSFSFLKDQMKLNNESFIKTFEQLKHQIVTDQENAQKKLVAVIWILFILFFITILILLIEIRFQLISKAMDKCFENDKKQRYKPLRTIHKENEYEKNIKNQLLQINQQLEIIMKTYAKETGRSNQKHKANESESTVEIKFKMIHMNNVVSLEVFVDDNVLKIKKEISLKLLMARNDDYKIMKLKYKGIYLDNNDYLLKYLDDSENYTIECELDDMNSAKNIIVLQVKGNRHLPELIQIKKSQTIGDLKKIITQINSSIQINNIKIFKNSNLLKNEDIIEKCDLIDLDTIKVIEKEKMDVAVKSLFDDKEMILIDSWNFDQVCDLKKKVAKRLYSNYKDISFIFENIFLSNDSFLFEISIKNDSQIDYLIYKSINSLQIEESGKIERQFSTIFKANDLVLNKKVILKRYHQSLINNDDILSDLIPFRNNKLNPSFVHIFDFYRDDEYFFCSLEYLEQGSFEDLIKDSKRFPVNEYLISKWSKQILKGMQYMYINRYDQGNIRPSCFLIDGENDVKIASFGLSTNLQGYRLGQLSDDFIETYQGIMRYMAPETFTNKNFGLKCNVWSFGAILIELVTGKPPYPDLTEKEAAKEIVRSKTIIFNPLNMSAVFKLFIDRCLESDPKKRSNIEELRNDPFLLD